MQGIGKAIQFYNLLQARANIRGVNRLSDMEQEFLEIAELGETDRAQANKDMTAFVNFNSSVEGLSDSDLKVLEHATYFKEKIVNDARESYKNDVKKIRSAMETAARSDSVQEKKAIYESIVQIYQNLVWSPEDEEQKGQQLINEASELLDELENR